MPLFLALVGTNNTAPSCIRSLNKSCMKWINQQENAVPLYLIHCKPICMHPYGFDLHGKHTLLCWELKYPSRPGRTGLWTLTGPDRTHRSRRQAWRAAKYKHWTCCICSLSCSKTCKCRERFSINVRIHTCKWSLSTGKSVDATVQSGISLL